MIWIKINSLLANKQLNSPARLGPEAAAFVRHRSSGAKADTDIPRSAGTGPFEGQIKVGISSILSG